MHHAECGRFVSLLAKWHTTAVEPGEKRVTDHERSIFPILLISMVLVLISPTASAKKEEVKSNLEGTWYVLVHYTDDLTTHRESVRWLDRVWTFKIKGSRLVWADYPIVVIDDSRGRFERLGTNLASRVVGPWEPNQKQLKEIMGGPRVNSRGSRTKSLHGSDEKGWKSVGRQAVGSASAFGYQQTWVIDLDGEAPVFEVLESIGNEVTETEDGKTVYQETNWARPNEEIRGIFNRDGTRRGTFRMFRTPKLRALLSEESGKTPNEKRRDEAIESGKMPTLPF